MSTGMHVNECVCLFVDVCAGEVHLETCIKDLKERFARCELLVSAPLVAFR
jgi:ribosome assembly protein 1